MMSDFLAILALFLTTQGQTGYWKEAFGPASVPNWALFFAALLTLVVLGWQAKESKRAAVSAEKAADAAVENTKAIMSAKRAWVLIAPVNERKEHARNNIFTLHWSAKNVGKTPARLIETQAKCQKGAVWDVLAKCQKGAVWDVLTVPPDYGKPIVLNERILAPGDSIGFHVYCEEWVEMGNDSLYLLAFGYVKYLNVFGDVCESRFCNDYSWRPGDNPVAEFHPKLDSPREYTQHS